MPEYLAPGVYVEEVSTGAKPIEGVSTSTAGLIGVTERGPLNVPMLVTSFGEFRRVFGGYLDIDDFTDPSGRAHAYLPHAAEGFFANGGKRAWVTRAAPVDARRADRRLFFRDIAVPTLADSVLLRPAEQGTGTAINQPSLYVLDTTNLVVGDVARVGDGSPAEYRAVASIDADATHVSLNLPLSRAHAASVSVREVVRTPDAAFTSPPFTLTADVAAGASQVTLSGTAPDIAALAPGGLLEVGTSPNAEYLSVVSVTISPGPGTEAVVTLSDALQRAHAATSDVSGLTLPPAPPIAQAATVAANSGDSLVYLDSLGGNFTNPARLVVIDAGTPDAEVRRIGTLSSLGIDRGPYEPYPAGSLVQRVGVPDDDRTVDASFASSIGVVTLNDVRGIVPGMSLAFGADTRVVTNVDPQPLPSLVGQVTLQSPLGGVPANGSVVTTQQRALTAAAAVGAVVISVDNRLGLSPGDVIRIGVSPDQEFLTIREVRDPRNVPPDAGSIVLDSPLRLDHPVGADVHRTAPAVDTSVQSSLTVLAAGTDSQALLLADGSGYAVGDALRVTTPAGGVHYHQVTANTATSPRGVTLVHALDRSHGVGAVVDERTPLLQVRVLDPGAWGNRLLVSSADETSGLLNRAEVTGATPSPGPGIPSTLRLTTVTGVEAGTILELRDPDDIAQVDALLKVRRVDKVAGNLVVLDAPGLQAGHMAAFSAAALGGRRLVARSREFRLEVFLLSQPAPAVPSRAEELLDREMFRHLSMDPRHSRYVERVVGSTWTDGNPDDDLGRPLRRSDRRSEGASEYVRVHDLEGLAADREAVRLGPEALTDLLPSGLPRAARHRLGEGEDAAVRGDDSVTTMDDAMYIGVDDREPENRTGLYTLKNVQNISLVAAPGQTTAAVQQALIDHCEEARYRFAVLDAQGPSADTIADVQAQRQQFDTRYAAFYHPWLTIPHPFPDNLSTVPQYPIPPSGHVLGVYARSDIERGVHKAPANEVVRGITGLTRSLNKGEHDVLNAYPVHIDVIRDFRPNNRGIRVWGARCITSDSEYKYVNVRRLLIFLEDSIDRGLQWVVFEPNAEELWARVRRTIINFLTVVWRNGALEGTTREEAFFVKCDRTTMTQTDLDNGRLICLIGVAPVKPAEFVIIRIGLWTADRES